MSFPVARPGSSRQVVIYGCRFLVYWAWVDGLNVDLLSYAEAGEYFPEQIIGGKFAGDFGQSILRELQFLGKKLDLRPVLQGSGQVLAGFAQCA